MSGIEIGGISRLLNLIYSKSVVHVCKFLVFNYSCMKIATNTNDSQDTFLIHRSKRKLSQTTIENTVRETTKAYILAKGALRQSNVFRL